MIFGEGEKALIRTPSYAALAEVNWRIVDDAALTGGLVLHE